MSPLATAEPKRKSHHFLILAAVAAIAGAAVWTHGRWWLAPLGVMGAHLVLVGGAFTAHRLLRRRAPDSDAGLIHRARLYDWGVGLLTLGRERRLRSGIVDGAGLGPGQQILDVGCGTGTLLIRAAERVGPSGRLAGVEASPEMLARARAKVGAAGVSVELVQGRAESLPFPDADFDVVLCTLVLHHLSADARRTALAEIRRTLRPGGRVAVLELARPATVAAVLAPVAVLHGVRQHGHSDRIVDVSAELAAAGFGDLETQTVGFGMELTIGWLAGADSVEVAGESGSSEEAPR